MRNGVCRVFLVLDMVGLDIAASGKVDSGNEVGLTFS
jgi:hypothetical protein